MLSYLSFATPQMRSTVFPKLKIAKGAEKIHDTVQVVQSLVGAIPHTDLPLIKLREERLEKYRMH